MAGDCTITGGLTADERAFLAGRIETRAMSVTGGRFRAPGTDIYVAAVDPDGAVVGGLDASVKLGVMFLEVLWVDGTQRERGLGGAVLLEAERVAAASGCGAAQTWTFSFQAPEFYAGLGYRRIGHFDAYPGGISEHVMMKRLPGDPGVARAVPEGFSIVPRASREDLAPVYAGFHDFCVQEVGPAMDGVAIDLALRDRRGGLAGGLHAWTTLQVMVLEEVWVHPEQRGNGFGGALLAAAEQAARDQGCISVQTAAFDFQSPGFFARYGYEAYGRSDAYPDPYLEYYLVKRLR